jgi:hypothetical protein
MQFGLLNIYQKEKKIMLKNKILLRCINKIENLLNIKIRSLYSVDVFNSIVEKALIELYSHEENLILDDGITCIIFSKDRALQLYALLESMHFYTRPKFRIAILYTASDQRHSGAYSRLIFESRNFYSNIDWIEEVGNFKSSLISLLSTIYTNKIFFLTDDNIFINHFDFADCNLYDCGGSVFSLRHSTNITYSYTEGRKYQSPKFTNSIRRSGLFEFRWFDSPCEWSDPWSVDGQIYKISEIKVLSRISSYLGPNSYEAALKRFNFMMRNRVGVCTNTSIVLNIPINLTQNEWKNKFGGLSSLEYLIAWDNGKKLDISFLSGHNPSSTHEVHFLPLIDR